ncbi:ABC transporter permease [Undibacterium sp. Jales W-56]|uniref:ABC transporter permease n=1 Tax=Undibacterium sp. Jales W-56 TaxID=2897325 RepID=UPI0021D2805C|nr:ABC transporter permease [Undibacterium sp. Jales W-56]MCU6433280.1 ABC transporter permease [Undibacterium sp. Jales W-56]
MTALIALIRKDLILFFSDRRAMLLTLMMPIILGGFFGFVTGGSGDKETSKIPVALVLQDQHQISQKIADGLKSESSLEISELALEQAQEQVRKGKLNVAVVIPAGFGEAAGAALFGGGTKPELPIYYDPSQSAVLAMVKGILTQYVMQNVSAEMFGGKAGLEMVDKSIRDFDAHPERVAAQPELKDFLGSLKKFQNASLEKSSAAAAASASSAKERTPQGGLSVPFVTRDQAMVAGDPVTAHYNGYAHSFAGMTVQFILFMAIDAGISILLARRLGLWNRLLAAPVGLNTLLIARALSCALIAFVLTGVIFAVAAVIFKVKIAGSFVGFIGLALSFSLMTASFGLLIAAFGKTPEAARGISVFATLIMVMLGGAWMPSFLFPQWLQNLTLIIPTRWAVDGFDAMTWRGLGLDAALPAIGVQLAFCLLFVSLALWRFRKQQNNI